MNLEIQNKARYAGNERATADSPFPSIIEDSDESLEQFRSMNSPIPLLATTPNIPASDSVAVRIPNCDVSKILVRTKR
jgi:hypothetical protein